MAAISVVMYFLYGLAIVLTLVWFNWELVVLFGLWLWVYGVQLMTQNHKNKDHGMALDDLVEDIKEKK